MSAPAGIEVEQVSMEYETTGGLVRALADVSLRVPAGETLAIVGPSGCGKSTLLGLLGGLEVPTRGTVRIGEHEVSRLSDRARGELRRHELGFVFQSDNLLPFLTAVENVALQLSLQGAGQGYERCLELLERLGLGGEADRLPDQLSGGQRQRVAVARALVHRPSVIFADEPTGALDTGNSARVLDLLLASGQEIGATLVMVTHDAEAAERMDRTLALRDGRLGEPVGGVHAR